MTLNLSAPAEDCLLLVHRLTERNEAITTSAMARALGVTDSTVTAMIQKLAKLKLLNHRPRKEISLTKVGSELALKMIRRHRLIETFLYDKLGYAWDEVHVEAERMEHFVSAKFVEAINSEMGNPTLDPHGDPIPDGSGMTDKRDLIKLTDAQPGMRGKLARVVHGMPEALVYLSEQGMLLGAELEIIETPEHDNIIRLSVNGCEKSIGERLASQIYIERHS
jgi:DtxR family Mn-dependent transcriptional regulator